MTEMFVHTSEHRQTQLSEALEAVMGLGGFSESTAFPPKVNDRLRVVNAIAEKNNASIPASAHLDANRLLAQAHKSKTRESRLIWLRRAADRVTQAAAPHAACMRGCSHCCHIPVAITAAEAHEIGKQIGIQPLQSPDSAAQEPGYENPCTFLHDNACSIYENRPIACRTHLNLDNDSLLCQLIPGAGVPVPLLNLRAIQLGAYLISGGVPDKIKIHDIREWFPKGRYG